MVNMSSKQNRVVLGYIGDYTTQLYIYIGIIWGLYRDFIGIIINHYKDAY